MAKQAAVKAIPSGQNSSAVRSGGICVSEAQVVIDTCVHWYKQASCVCPPSVCVFMSVGMYVSKPDWSLAPLDRCVKATDLNIQQLVSSAFNRYANHCQTFDHNASATFLKNSFINVSALK